MNRNVGITFCGEEKILPYEKAIRDAGLTPIRLFPASNVETPEIEGLLLTGGVDVNPKRYGQEPVPETNPPDDARDEMELRILKATLEARRPVLAICRGMQLLNVAHGGTLRQHLPSNAPHVQRLPDEIPGQHRAAHQITVIAGTQLAGIVGAGTHPVNSRHHQAIDRLGQHLVATALSDDGVIEALERPDMRFALAVQWHPEDRVEASGLDRKLFEAFAEAVLG